MTKTSKTKATRSITRIAKRVGKVGIRMTGAVENEDSITVTWSNGETTAHYGNH